MRRLIFVAVLHIVSVASNHELEIDPYGTASNISSILDGYNVSDPDADHTEHAIMLDERGDMRGAVASFQAAAAFDPQEPTAWFNLGTALFDENNPAREEELWEARKVVCRKHVCNMSAICSSTHVRVHMTTKAYVQKRTP